MKTNLPTNINPYAPTFHTLVIAEKPELALAISKAIDPNYKKIGNSYYDCGQAKVIWCYGRMLELYDPEDYDEKYKKWNMEDLPIKIPRPWKKKIAEKNRHQVHTILKMIGEAKTIVNAGDVDEMGQLIVDELIMLAGKARIQGKSIKRLLINDNNPKAVKKALGNLQDNAKFRGLYLMAESQSLADQNFGYNLSRAYTLASKSKTTMSVGRVQTPILGLVVRRDIEKANHQKTFYYTLSTAFKFSSLEFSAYYLKKEADPFDGKGRMLDPKFFESIADTIRGQKALVANKRQEKKQILAPLPYSLLKLQADASDLLGISMQETLEITQTLRTKCQLITYNRSTSEYLNEERHSEAPDVIEAIKANLNEHNQTKANPFIKGRAFDNSKVDAHHAIIPTETVANMGKLSAKERSMYELIARRYLAQFYPPYLYEETRVLIQCTAHHFVAIGHKPLEQGWKALYPSMEALKTSFKEPEEDEDELNQEEQSLDLNILAINDQGINTLAEMQKKATKPKPHYTEKTLLIDLTRVANYVKDPKLKQVLKSRDQGKKGEHGGIGTPATRAEIIKTLEKRGFITVTKKTIQSTPLGQAFYQALPDSVKYPDMTAIWHEQQEGIKNGTMKIDDFLNSLEQFITKEITELRTNPEYVTSYSAIADSAVVATPKKPEKIYTCLDCASKLIKRKGKNGDFWGCSHYPICTRTFKNERNKPFLH